MGDFDQKEFDKLYQFLKSADEDDADIVCLKCKKMSDNVNGFSCDEDHYEYTLQNTHDTPGAYYYANCLEFLVDSGIVEL